MNITLGPDAERLVREKVASGEYPSAEAVVLAGLEALTQGADDFTPGELDALLAKGEASLAKEGPVSADAVFDRLQRRSDERRGRGR